MNTIRIEADGDFHALEFTDRDFSLLGGPELFMPKGNDFIRQLGVYENTSVAQDMKIPPGSFVRRNRFNFMIHTQELLTFVNRDADLLAVDYSFRLTGSDEKHRLKGTLTGFQVRGLSGCVDAQPHGFCTLRLSEVSPTGLGRDVELIDLRNQTDLATDNKGMLMVHRRPAPLGWPASLPTLIEFLKRHSCPDIVVHHA
jgi:hypothetical protein